MKETGELPLPPPLRASDICSALRLRYPRESHALLFEVANGTGAGGKRYADAVAVGLWPSHGHAIEGIEVKVSRSDFLNEMKQPQKSDEVFRFCHQWWLACPKDMVKPDEIPNTWGLLELQGTTLRVRVKAPKLKPVACTMGFIASMLRRHAGCDEEMAANEIHREVERQTERVRARYENKAQHDHSARVTAAEESMKLLERIKTEAGLDLLEHRYRNEELLAGIKLAIKLNGRWDGIAGLRKAAAHAIAAIDESGLVARGGEDA